jgi:hypothetical protein
MIMGSLGPPGPCLLLSLLSSLLVSSPIKGGCISLRWRLRCYRLRPRTTKTTRHSCARLSSRKRIGASSPLQYGGVASDGFDPPTSYASRNTRGRPSQLHPTIPAPLSVFVVVHDETGGNAFPVLSAQLRRASPGRRSLGSLEPRRRSNAAILAAGGGDRPAPPAGTTRASKGRSTTWVIARPSIAIARIMPQDTGARSRARGP